MKHRTELIRRIATAHMTLQLTDVDKLHRMTSIRRNEIETAIDDMCADGWIEKFGKLIYLTERGWEQYERDKPRVVSADMLVSHADGGDV